MEPEAISGVVINASAGGLRVAVDQCVDVGSLCFARIKTAREHESLEHAEVVWARELPDGWLLGLRFVT